MVNTYIQYGVPSDLTQKLKSLSLPKTTFEKTSNKNLVEKYGLSVAEVELVKECITRKAIDVNTVEALLKNSNYTCCICKGTKGKSYIIHHIEEFSVSQNNQYYNLAVLCPDDHDLAHKTGKSLTLKLTQDQIYKAKETWEKEVKNRNIEKASRNGNIFEIDFINIPRILELCIELFGGVPETTYTATLIKDKLIKIDGNINLNKVSKIADNPSTPLIFFNPLGSAMLLFHYYEIFKKVLATLNFKDLDTLLTQKSVKEGIVGEYCFYVGGLYSSKLPNSISNESEFMKFHIQKKPFSVEWLVDPKFFTSSSAKWRTSNRTVYMIFGKIRNVEIEEIEGKRHILIDIRPYCFGLPELQKDRKPNIAYRDIFDDIFDEDQDQ
ncbi:hypothetical protein C8C83_4411 [Flavobacterium sp. 90]|uniref:HNH endonuclease n=1 Tax=unclassified Flavobacterium TaxID=196869 RepID=UPI000EAD72DB|nr:MULTISPECIES: HNH endonuclease signature motif containing protein [unclassified Flavobacterium]RKR05082.1 hypothetical protein C8C82_4751 [Flavobacterium sp. 81]TCK56398.1 hypothetical protein C8C83_4411 [Flavobacterium sp. 90]